MKSKTFKEILDETPKEVEDKVRQYAKAMMEEPKELTEEEIIREWCDNEDHINTWDEGARWAKQRSDTYWKYQLEKKYDGSDAYWESQVEELKILLEAAKRALESQKEHYLKMVEEEAKTAFIAGLHNRATMDNLFLKMPDLEEYMKQLKERLK